jgi:hypothetical protein
MTAATLRTIIDRPAVRSLVRACACAAIGALDRTAPTRVAAREWSDDRTAEWLTRAPVAITDTESAPPLVRTVLADFIATLAPTSAAARLFREGLQLNFDRAGEIAVPTIFGNSAYASFVAEGKPIPVHSGHVEPLTFVTPKKLAAQIVLTSEMVRSSNIEALMTDALVRSTGLALDAALFDDVAESAERPAGIRYGVAALFASTAPDPVAALMSDIETLSRAVAPVTATYPVLIMSPTRALTAELRSQHGLRPLTVFGSAPLRGTMIMIALTPDNLVSVFGDRPSIIARREAAMAMTSTPVEGDPSTQSMWQTDCVGLTVRLPVTWGVRSNSGVAWLVATNW